MNHVDELAHKLRRNEGNRSFTFEGAAIIAFKYFHEIAKKQVIDEDILKAILRDAGVET